jgi:hypothetical protein
MDILIFGRWVMLVIGAGALIGAILLTVLKPEAKRPLFMWIFGVLIAGIGVFGLEFVPKYREWLDSVGDIIKSPSKESYEAFFAKIGNDEIPVELQEIGITYAINNPIEGMNEILATAINSAPADTNGKKALEWAKKGYQEKQHVIDQLLKSKPTVDTAKNFDPMTSSMFYERLKKLPRAELQSYGIDPGQIQNYEPERRPFPGKK